MASLQVPCQNEDVADWSTFWKLQVMLLTQMLMVQQKKEYNMSKNLGKNIVLTRSC